MCATDEESVRVEFSKIAFTSVDKVWDVFIYCGKATCIFIYPSHDRVL